jgi:hypothetical protein
MKSSDERKYFRLLENIVKHRKGNTRFLSARDGDAFRLEISSLLHYVNRLHPGLADSLFSKEISLTRIPVIREKELRDYVLSSDKGSVFQFRDSRGNVKALINAGKNYLSGKNSVIVLSNSLKIRDIPKYRQYLYLALLQKDIEQVYRNMAARQRKNYPPQAGSVLLLNEKNTLRHSSGEFEKNFKSLIREQGYGADSLLTAKILAASMSPADKSELNKNLISSGIRNQDALERLLSKWKSEALLANHGRERARPLKRTLAAGLER